MTLAAIAVVDAACCLVIGQPLEAYRRSWPSASQDRCPSCCCRFCWGWLRDPMSAGVLSMPVLILGIAPMFAQMVDGFSEVAPTCHRRR
ncbi:MAG: hypothetical protein ACLSVD_16030 [Eggerthellaceae bacterium]